MHGLDRFQPPVEFVELGVRNDRRVLLVVREAVLADLLDKDLVLFAHGLGGGVCFGFCCSVPCAHRPILP